MLGQPSRKAIKVKKDQPADLDAGRTNAKRNPPVERALRDTKECGKVLHIAVPDAVDDQFVGVGEFLDFPLKLRGSINSFSRLFRDAIALKVDQLPLHRNNVTMRAA
jgi:hypothetical protein